MSLEPPHGATGLLVLAAAARAQSRAGTLPARFLAQKALLPETPSSARTETRGGPWSHPLSSLTITVRQHQQPPAQQCFPLTPFQHQLPATSRSTVFFLTPLQPSEQSEGERSFPVYPEIFSFLRDCGSTATSFKEEKDAGSQWFEIS